MKIRSRLFLYTTILALFTAIVTGIAGYHVGSQGFRTGTKNLLSQIRTSKTQELKREIENISNSLVSLAEVTTLKNLVPHLQHDYSALTKGISTPLKSGYEYSEINRFYKNINQPEFIRAISRIPAPAVFIQSTFIQESKARNVSLAEIGTLSNPPPFQYFKTIEKIQPYYLDVQQKNSLADIMIVDANGLVLYSVSKGISLGTNLQSGVFSRSPLAKAFRWSMTASPSSYRIFDLAPLYGQSTPSYFYIALPIYEKSRAIGSIIAQISSHHVDTILSDDKQWRRLGLKTSGEVILVGKDGLLRSNSRKFIEGGGSELGPHLTKDIRNLDTVALRLGYPERDVQQWIRAQDGISSDTDYLGQKTLRSFGHLVLPGVEWIVIAKIDQHETIPSPFASWSNLVGILILVCLVLIAGSYYLASYLTVPIIRLKEGFAYLRHSTQNKKIEYHHDDEFTPLIEDLNLLSEDLKTMKTSTRYLTTVLDSIDELLIVVDSNNLRIQTVNPATRKILEASISDLEESELKKWLLIDFEMLNSSHHHIEAHLKSTTGETIPVEISWNRNLADEDLAHILVITGTDIRKRKEEEKSHALKETLFRECQSVSKIGSFYWDFKDKKVIWSEETYQNFGLDQQSSIPSYGLFRSLILPEDLEMLDKQVKETSNALLPFTVDVRLRKANTQELVWIRCSARTDFNDSGEPIRLYGTNQDITALKRTEQAYIMARNDALKSSHAKSEFLARMSHEIRTPMNAIMGMADLLKETKLSDEQQYFVSIFCKAGEVLMALINDILDLSKIEAGEVSIENIPFDLHRLLLDIQDIMKPRALDRGLEYSFNISPQISPYLMGDPTKLRQILINLVSNSLKFTERGSVRINIGRNPSKKDYLLVSVTDTGLGIPVSKQHLIFQKFSQADSTITRKYGGTGLGLAISKSLTELMGGQIWFKSREGLGTSFFITIPYREQITHPVSHKPLPMQTGNLQFLAKSVRPPNQKVRILLADDNEDNRILFTRFLKDGPFEIIEAENGLEAIDKIKSEKFDLVFMDVQMPELDGYAATEIIRRWEKTQNRPPTPIIALTAHALSEDRSKSLKVGCDEHITKPFKKNTILSVIQKYS